MHVPPRLMATRSSVNICCGLRRAGRAMVVREGLASPSRPGAPIRAAYQYTVVGVKW